MPIIYNVTVNPTEEDSRFLIRWRNENAGTEDCFETSAAEMIPGDIRTLWLQPQHQMDIGQRLFHFLDGDARHFQRALNEANRAGELLQLHLVACNQVSNWPFELLAREGSFLLPLRLHLVRRVSDWGAAKEMPPENRQLKMLFMACSALDVQPELDFEKEEEAIFHITEKLAIDMEVEDSGALQGLREKLEREKYDVVHLSGHAGIDESGRPYFIMEDETGNRSDVSPAELWNKALIENPPRLLFLSGCHTAGGSDNGAAVSFAHMLMENPQVPAVLGWGRSVGDEQAIYAEEILYRQLSRGKSIIDAVQRARHELATKYESSSAPAWPLLRLFSNGLPLYAMVTEGQPQKPQPRTMVHVFLEESRVQVLKEGFVGRRRHLQQSLRALKHDRDKIGALFLGAGGLGKSCLAGKICERFTDHTLIIVHGKLNAITLEAALTDAFIISQDEKGRQILSQKMETTDKLAKLCAACFKEKKYLLILDDFEQNLEDADKGQPGSILPEAAQLLKVLLHYLRFGGKMTQLVITCRYEFSLTEKDRDLVEEKLAKVWLTGFQESERFKKARELKNIFNYEDRSMLPDLLAAGHGNPRLMEWIDQLVGRMAGVEVRRLVEAIKDKQEDFIRAHVIRQLLQRGGQELELLLRRISIYRLPVMEQGVQAAAEKAGLKKWKKLVEKGRGLSLIEYDSAHRSYQLTPLLREEFFSKLEDIPSCHEAAFEYYKTICEARESVDPILVEEWIFHALGCGQEKAASEQGGRLVKQLRERLAFRESRRVGMWLLEERKTELSDEFDAFLLNETAYTLKSMGDHDRAAKYYEQALEIDRAMFGESHPTVARDLNNLGAALRGRYGPGKALEYFERALHIIDGEGFVDKHPDIAGNLFNNLGTACNGLGDYRKAMEYYKKALDTWEKAYGERDANVAIVLNNLGAACNRSGNYREAADYFKEALSIDQSVYGKMHFEVATDLNNLGAVFSNLGDHKRAIDYYDKALTIWRQIYGPYHPNTAVTLSNIGEAYLGLGQKEKAKEYFEEAYTIFKEIFGPENENTKAIRSQIEFITSAKYR